MGANAMKKNSEWLPIALTYCLPSSALLPDLPFSQYEEKHSWNAKTRKEGKKRIIFKFIETGSTGKTKDFVRELGIKSPRDGLFSSGDVTKLIKDGAEDISPALLAIARQLASARNKNGPSR